MTRALVTGAGIRLGRAMALYLAQRGYDVAVHYATSAGPATEAVSEVQAMGRKAARADATPPSGARVGASFPGLRKPSTTILAKSGLSGDPFVQGSCGTLGLPSIRLRSSLPKGTDVTSRQIT